MPLSRADNGHGPKARVIKLWQRRLRVMTKVGQKYRCNVCGNEVVVTNAGEGELVCCGQPMENIGEGFECK
jgi:desulfoferrodoxin-like iron-binding protein